MKLRQRYSGHDLPTGHCRHPEKTRPSYDKSHYMDARARSESGEVGRDDTATSNSLKCLELHLDCKLAFRGQIRMAVGKRIDGQYRIANGQQTLTPDVCRRLCEIWADTMIQDKYLKRGSARGRGGDSSRQPEEENNHINH